MADATVSMGEVKKLVNYTIDNNLKLEEDGKTPIALCLEAEAGIGKTSILQQIAAERNMTCTKLSLHELDEAGDLIGFPQLEYECQVAKKYKEEDGTVKAKILPGMVWLNAKQIESKDANTMYRQTGNTRMAYAKPAWVPEYNENGNMFILDDYGRCNSQLAQAVMELILTQGYVSWKLPKKSSIFMTSNPDNGEYNVNSMDEAQRTRFMSFNVARDVNAWSKWAEKAGIDGRCINFAMNYFDELFASDDDGNHICNPRSYVMFANMISGIKDWDDAENLAFITTISKGCFKDENGRFSKMFMSFIRNKMHLIIQPKEILLGGWDTVKDKLSALLYDGNGDYRGDIASLLERRFCNYVSAWLSSEEKTPISTVKDRILDLIKHDEADRSRAFFNQDLYYHMIKTITSDNKRQTGKLMFEPKIAKIVS